jgi:beta-glucosidase
MTTDEKVLQVHGTGALGSDGGRDSPDITRLGLPGYKMSNGAQAPCVGSSGNATAQPTPSAMACTFDTTIIKRAGAAIAEEYWAKGKYMIEAPIIGLVKDPRCGRASEAFSEDPYLAGMMGAAYCKGAQATGVGTICKHLVCNEIETARKTSSSNVSERTLRELYGMSFEYAVKEGKTLGIMSAYNMINNIYNGQNQHTLTDMLKYDWGHRGFVVSDWASLHTTAASANAGQDVELIFTTYFGTPLTSAVSTGQVSLARLDDMARRIVRNKIYSDVLNKMTAAARTKYASALCGTAHQQVCLDIARESIVLAKNTGNVLPLDKNTVTSIAVVGPFANTARLSGSGSGAVTNALAANLVTPLAGITAKVGAAKVVTDWTQAQVVVVVIGVTNEGEGHDRSTLAISADAPEGNALVTSVLAAGKKCIVVLTGGSAASKDVWYNAPAVLVAWYPGEKQGTALADIIFGDVNPSGRLSCSFPVSSSSLPAFSSTATQLAYESPDTGIGYRWYDRTGIAPFLPFGHGLSYTTFAYSNIRFSANPIYVGEDVVVTATITNTGTRAGDEVAQLYISEKAPAKKRPVKELRGFARVTLNAGESKNVSFKLRPRELAYFDDAAAVNKFVVQPDDYIIQVGGSSAVLPLSSTLTVR